MTVGVLLTLITLGRIESARHTENFRKLTSLSVINAKSQALIILRCDPSFKCGIADQGFSSASLPLSVCELFSSYNEIVRGEFCLSKTSIDQSRRCAAIRLLEKISNSKKFSLDLRRMKFSCDTAIS